VPSGYTSTQPGPTPSVPLNLATGATVIGGSNALTVSQQGADIAGIAAGTTLLFQWLKQYKWFDQHRWAPLTLLVIAVLITIGVYLLAKGIDANLGEAIPRGMWAAWQAFENYVGQKATGLGGLPAAN